MFAIGAASQIHASGGGLHALRFRAQGLGTCIQRLRPYTLQSRAQRTSRLGRKTFGLRVSDLGSVTGRYCPVSSAC